MNRLLLLPALLFNIGMFAQEAPRIQLSQPILGADSTALIEGGSLTVAGIVSSATEIILLNINGTEITVGKDGSFQHLMKLQPGTDKVVIGAANKAFKRSYVRFKVRTAAPVIETIAVDPPPVAPDPVAIEPIPVKEVPAQPVIVSYTEEGDEGEPPTALDIRALIVGVGQHQFSADKDLQYPAKDALAVYDFITSPEGLAADPKNVRLLVDQNATRSAILLALRDMMNGGNSTDVFFLYFSGHGQTVDNGKDYYFFTHDTQAKDQGSIVSTGLSRTELLGKLGDGKVRKKILFLDACYSGMMAQTGGKSMGERREHLFAEMARTDDALVIFTSSSDTEMSYEDASLGGGHGIFTYYLVKGLQGDADRYRSGNKNGKVTVYELDRYLGDEVNTRANDLKNLPQRPKRNCERCDDFPLSVTTDYDITTAVPRPVAAATLTEAPVTSEPPTIVPVVSPSGRNYEAYKLPTPPKEIYTPAVNPRFLNAQVYANSTTGDKITFDRHHYSEVLLTGILGGRIISAKGTVKGILINFNDQITTDDLKESNAVFSPDSSTMTVTLNFASGTREKYALALMGVAKREPIQGRRFTSADGQTELCVHNLHYAEVFISGHVGNTIVDCKGEVKGDVILFVDERKDAYASGQLVLSDDWSMAQGSVAFTNGTKARLDLTVSRIEPDYELNKAIFQNATEDQTINFHSPHYSTIQISGMVGEGAIACTGTVKGDVVSVNDDPKNTQFRPSKLVLRDKGKVLQGSVIFADGTVIKVNMTRAK